MTVDIHSDISRNCLTKINDKSAVIGVIGLGYVGLPLAAACARVGFKTIGFDVDETKIPLLSAGQSYIDAVSNEELSRLLKSGTFRASSDLDGFGDCDVIIICVPTPLTQQREPDLSFVVKTAQQIAKNLKSGQTIILESTTWPGTTVNIVKPILEAQGFTSDVDIFIGFSPEREDPGNAHHSTVTIPKVVSGDGAAAGDIVAKFYNQIVDAVVPVSTPDTAEAVKITENIFRAVNIALVNELKVVYDAMGIDVWEVINAAKTKPFGYMPFYPGPGLGGHCIPIDPFYLTWRAREFDITTRFIELAGEVNRAMPSYVITRLSESLDSTHGKSLSRSKILILGLAYKKNVSDIRESPTFKIMELLDNRGAHVNFHDPHVDVIPTTREHAEYTGKTSIPLTAKTLSDYDAVMIVTDHDGVDYVQIVEHASLIIDTRNAIESRGIISDKVIKA